MHNVFNLGMYHAYTTEYEPTRLYYTVLHMVTGGDGNLGVV